MSLLIITAVMVVWASRTGKLSDLEAWVNSKFEGVNTDELRSAAQHKIDAARKAAHDMTTKP